MIEFAQDIIVTSVAASAVVVLGRRVVGALRPGKGQAQPTCLSCASGAAACAKPSAHQSQGAVQPVTFVR